MLSRNTARACLPGFPASLHPDASWKWRSCQETWHDITYIKSSLRHVALLFSLLFKRRTADGASALHKMEIILRRAAVENKAIIRRIRRAFSQVALRLSCERCFDAGKSWKAMFSYSTRWIWSCLCKQPWMHAEWEARRSEETSGESRAQCRAVCLRLASERILMYHKYC